MATVSEDGKQVALMAVNASWTNATPATIKLRDFAAQSAEGVVLSHSDRTAHPLLEKREDFVTPLAVERSIEQDGSTLRFNLPPHSIVFLDVR